LEALLKTTPSYIIKDSNRSSSATDTILFRIAKREGDLLLKKSVSS
jgi:hypothetical protein